MSRAITEGELRELYAPCLAHFHPLLEPNDEDYKNALAWARAPLQSRAALLMRVAAAEEGVEGFHIFDYVRDWVDGSERYADPGLRDVLDSTWPCVIRQAEPVEALAIGFAAYSRGKVYPAEVAVRKAADSGDPDVASMAAFNLGLLLKEQGHPEKAQDAYQLAIDTGTTQEDLVQAAQLALQQLRASGSADGG